MTAEQLRKAAIELFGEERGWKTRLAEALYTDGGNVSRWLSGNIPVPGPVRAAVECWIATKRTARKNTRSR